MFALTFAAEWTRQTLFEPMQRSRWRAASLIVGWLAFIMVFFEGATWLGGTAPAHGDLTTRNALSLWMAASIPWMPWLLAHVADARLRRHRE